MFTLEVLEVDYFFHHPLAKLKNKYFSWLLTFPPVEADDI